MPPKTQAPITSRQRQRIRQRSAQVATRTNYEKQERALHWRIDTHAQTIKDLRQSSAQTDARLEYFTRSSTLDAQLILRQKEEIAKLVICNKKWDREGTRLRIENKRLRIERDAARAQSHLIRSAPPRQEHVEASSPPLTPRTPGRYDE